MSTTRAEVTRLLQDWSNGDPAALNRVLPIVYDELRRLAASYMRRERPGHTLQATGLVHEAYLRLAGIAEPHWDSRAHFYAAAAQAMRRILVDHARSKRYAKRGAGTPNLALEEASDVAGGSPVDLVALDSVLTRLEAFDPRKARIIELRYFGGLSVEQVATVMCLSTATVVNDTRAARAWIYGELASS